MWRTRCCGSRPLTSARLRLSPHDGKVKLRGTGGSFPERATARQWPSSSTASRRSATASTSGCSTRNGATMPTSAAACCRRSRSTACSLAEHDSARCRLGGAQRHRRRGPARRPITTFTFRATQRQGSRRKRRYRLPVSGRHRRHTVRPLESQETPHDAQAHHLPGRRHRRCGPATRRRA
jgi:hypothetical protein